MNNEGHNRNLFGSTVTLRNGNLVSCAFGQNIGEIKDEEGFYDSNFGK